MVRLERRISCVRPEFAIFGRVNRPMEKEDADADVSFKV